MKPIIIILVGIALTACSTEAVKPSKNLNMANPAAVYCQQVGGKLSSRASAAGTQGYCTLPSGEHVDEWDLYRRDHKQN